MAYARIIRQNFFNTPEIAKYTIDERYFLIGLACASDDYGRFWYEASNIKSTVFPTDQKITTKWINKCLKKFHEDFLICVYEVDNVLYAHFPQWFSRGWFLKQRLDHPREFESPDCPICQTEDKKREISRTSKYKLSKSNKKKGNLVKCNINEKLSTYVFSSEMIKKYPSIDKHSYRDEIDKYISWATNNNILDKEHKREFEGRLFALHEANGQIS